MTVYLWQDQILARLPPDCRRPIDPDRFSAGSGCTCPWCKEHPQAQPAWDTLNLTNPREATAWPWGFQIHFPGLEHEATGVSAATAHEEECYRRFVLWHRSKYGNQIATATHPCG